MIIYTLGTSNREISEFIELLDKYKIKIIADVRRFPTSKFEWFRRETLARILAGHMIGYIFLGNELGGYRKEDYETYTLTRAFQWGLEKIEFFSLTEKVGIICAERFPWKCHRKFIASCLKQRGWEVIHIIDKDKVWTPKTSY
jgi:uncharacterized protein (DUF488 family)